MLIYHIKLIHPVTKEIFYEARGRRPLLPSDEVFDKYPGAVLVICTGAS